VLVALGYSLGIIIQTTVMIVFAAKLYSLPLRQLSAPLGRALTAALVGSFAAYSALNFFVFGINPESFIGVFLHGLMGGVIGIGGVIAAYYVTKAPELMEIVCSVKGRKGGQEVVTVQDDVL